MNSLKKAIASASLAMCFTTASHAIAVTSEAPTGYFVPAASSTTDSPYYRYKAQDWSWTQSAIGGTFTTANLNISAFDVDFGQGEVDNIYANDSGTWVLLGSLGGANDIYAFTNFVLTSNFYDDIATGLQVMIDIDVNNQGWAVSLAKSVLTLDGGVLPPADPGTNKVPEPGSLSLLALGLVGVVAAHKRKRKA